MAAMDYLFYAGLLLLTHAVYMAYSIREQLQVAQHSRSYIPATNLEGHSVFPTTMMVPITIEVLAGMLLGIAGFAHRHKMQDARLCDVTKYLRYDNQMNSGVGFIHFNHRGTVACRKDELQDDSKSLLQKKKD
ncbi:conserved hypothetical protein [Leishmania braziliensis MHOM/BR/75/M2904]|uniref:Uncharacterized protein n=3 Tax=Viannia TaxID=37616 RepID=A4HAU4_LEIBR|nr:conserved hypothetical protein [Leishmania braziliensis MHOM/BR/75/M2904]KAI5686466.1 hypothetical protein MNV84_03080 [Leishmania braziliensis]CAJ2471393.1 unnamed protein product [Leishmania braziliensis]CAJ2471968.1 unnamed protein product [Leishmania braziliensis]CAM38528.1 conserved hypothetical protein [Leishmania braziliensis MHOM/BR/75/M2904]SYZ65225.1 hypothetical_protein [Leishmania braziliensis MHOM/BR/75/M2904]